MKKTLLLLLFLPFLSIAQQDKGDLVFIFQPTKYEYLRKNIQENQLLESFRKHANYTFAFPRDIPVYFCDCGVENAFYQPIGNGGHIKMCYEYIHKKFQTLLKKHGNDQAGIKLAGSAVLTLYHELGHAVVHQFDLATTGKEEDTADEFALWLLLKHPATESNLITYYSIMNWYHSAKSLQDVLLMGRAKYADTHSPSLERYYSLLSLFCGANIQMAKKWDLIGDNFFKDAQLPSDRAKWSISEYNNFKKDWQRILNPFLKIPQKLYDSNLYAPTDTVVISTHSTEAQSLYGKPGGAKTGLALNVAGWGMGARPQVNDEPNESGRIVFEITVDNTGDIINIRVKESTVSQSVVDVYKHAVARMKLVSKSDTIPSISKGTISFNIKSR